MRYRLRTLIYAMLILQIAIAALSVNFLTLPLRESDKAEAASVLVAWIVEGRPVPGFVEMYPDAKWMPSKERIFVVCEFLPSSTFVSSDSRVKRVGENESGELFEKSGFDKTDYITIERKMESKYVLVVELSNQFGGMGGHGYRFEFRRKLWGLRARGKLLWVS
jgi:hypothetical protein